MNWSQKLKTSQRYYFGKAEGLGACHNVCTYIGHKSLSRGRAKTVSVILSACSVAALIDPAMASKKQCVMNTMSDLDH